VRQIAEETTALVQRVRAGRASPDELRGSTFSLSNLGAYEIDAFTPILNLPECAILGLGRIIPKVVVVDAASERTAIRHMQVLSLTFDHRVVDGGPAARFLQRLKRLAERPYVWLVR
jgi:pyruvate dehydrogenase E2 component (dihydrolipoamide acetyltransferase)